MSTTNTFTSCDDFILRYDAQKYSVPRSRLRERPVLLRVASAARVCKKTVMHRLAILFVTGAHRMQSPEKPTKFAVGYAPLQFWG
jgi:hypothetical protein